MIYYTGIGSRKTPKAILDVMYGLAMKLGVRGYTLRSGGAAGADTAFEDGAISVNAPTEIYTPWLDKRRPDYRQIPLTSLSKELQAEAKEIAADIHPGWSNIRGSSKAIHARNILQVVGSDLKTLSSFVLCWTPYDDYYRPDAGGTAQACRMAIKSGIPIYNLRDEAIMETVTTWLNPKT